MSHSADCQRRHAQHRVPGAAAGSWSSRLEVEGAPAGPAGSALRRSALAWQQRLVLGSYGWLKERIYLILQGGILTDCWAAGELGVGAPPRETQTRRQRGTMLG